jgi:hypothetical protein
VSYPNRPHVPDSVAQLPVALVSRALVKSHGSTVLAAGASTLVASAEFAAGRAVNIRAHLITAMRNSLTVRRERLLPDRLLWERGPQVADLRLPMIKARPSPFGCFGRKWFRVQSCASDHPDRCHKSR